jgi:hypothetical protein
MKKSMKTSAVTFALLAAPCVYVNATESKSAVNLMAMTKVEAKAESKVETKVNAKV